MSADDKARLFAILVRAGVDGVKPEDFRMYASARRLYNFHIDNLSSY
jgi:methylamine---glutamate N-methyltransferase subunit B